MQLHSRHISHNETHAHAREIGAFTEAKRKAHWEARLSAKICAGLSWLNVAFCGE